MVSTTAVLFDLDGTLADTVPLISEHIAATITSFGVAVEPISVVPYIGRPLEFALAELSGFGAVDERIGHMVTGYHESWRGAINEQGDELLLPGVHYMLKALREDGWRIAVVTAKTTPEAVHLLERIGIRDDVEVVVGNDQVANGKPAPDSVLLGLRLLDAPLEGAWYVGDAASDMEMAMAAGTRAMGITTGASPREALLAAGAEIVVDSADEVTASLVGPAI